MSKQAKTASDNLGYVALMENLREMPFMVTIILATLELSIVSWIIQDIIKNKY